MYNRIAPYFEEFGKDLEELYAQYSDEELELIMDFQKNE